MAKKTCCCYVLPGNSSVLMFSHPMWEFPVSTLKLASEESNKEFFLHGRNFVYCHRGVCEKHHDLLFAKQNHRFFPKGNLPSLKRQAWPSFLRKQCWVWQNWHFSFVIFLVFAELYGWVNNSIVPRNRWPESEEYGCQHGFRCNWQHFLTNKTLFMKTLWKICFEIKQCTLTIFKKEGPSEK